LLLKFGILLKNIKDEMYEAIAAAELYIKPIIRSASNQRCICSGRRSPATVAQHIFLAATCLAGVAAETMPVALPGQLSNAQFISIAFSFLSQFPSFSIPAQLRNPVPSAWGQD
jgi:hypothetical protein